MEPCRHEDDKCEYWYMGLCDLDNRFNVCPYDPLYKQLQEFGGSKNVAERVHTEVIRDNEYTAEWVNIRKLAFPTKKTNRWYCSQCHGVIKGKRYRYCPHCGKLMKEVK